VAKRLDNLCTLIFNLFLEVSYPVGMTKKLLLQFLKIAEILSDLHKNFTISVLYDVATSLGLSYVTWQKEE